MNIFKRLFSTHTVETKTYYSNQPIDPKVWEYFDKSFEYMSKTFEELDKQLKKEHK